MIPNGMMMDHDVARQQLPLGQLPTYSIQEAHVSTSTSSSEQQSPEYCPVNAPHLEKQGVILIQQPPFRYIVQNQSEMQTVDHQLISGYSDGKFGISTHGQITQDMQGGGLDSISVHVQVAQALRGSGCGGETSQSSFEFQSGDPSLNPPKLVEKSPAEIEAARKARNQKDRERRSRERRILEIEAEEIAKENHLKEKYDILEGRRLHRNEGDRNRRKSFVELNPDEAEARKKQRNERDRQRRHEFKEENPQVAEAMRRRRNESEKMKRPHKKSTGSSVSSSQCSDNVEKYPPLLGQEMAVLMAPESRAAHALTLLQPLELPHGSTNHVPASVVELSTAAAIHIASQPMQSLSSSEPMQSLSSSSDES